MGQFRSSGHIGPSLLENISAARELLKRAELQACLREPSIIHASEPVEVARRIYRFRRQRDRFFPADLFAEPAWDMLLDLYVAHHEGRKISVSSACIGAGVPASTALRWLGALERAGLLVRETTRHDSRLVLVALTSIALDRMTLLLLKLSGGKNA